MLKANWQNLRKECDLLLRYSTWVPVEILPVHSVTSGISIIFTESASIALQKWKHVEGDDE